MGGLPDPDWYLDNVLVHAEPGGPFRAPKGQVAVWRELWRRLGTADDALLLASAQGFVLRTDQLAGLGRSRQSMRTALRRGNWTPAGRGYVAPFAIRTSDAAAARQRHAIRAAASALSRPGHVVSGRSAAILHGLPTLAVPALAELSAPTATGLGRRRVSHLHGARLTSDEIASWYGVPVTTVVRTLIDLARHDRRDAIMAADAALRERLVDHDGIDGALAGAAGWPGVRRARAVLALASPLAESPLESLTRLVLHDDGFPAPRLQVPIAGYRVDMLFEDQRLILEVDGLGKYTAQELRREKRREQRLRALGYRIERVTWDDILLHWTRTRIWLRAALHLPR